MSRIEELLSGLNEKQKQAATAVDGKYLVLASAGSGKTRVLTTRIAYLIEIGIKPWEIVGISFTKKAANEIKERVQSVVGEDALDVNMGTFHSLCMRILLKNQAALGMNNVTILDDFESKKVIYDIAMTYGYMSDDSIYEIKSSIDRWGNEGWNSEDVRAQENVPKDIVDIFEEYSAFKRTVGYVDFNDILSLTSELFRVRPDILELYSSKYKYIMVDENQDINNIQFKLLTQLSSYHKNFMMLGDDLQCIYSFRGSNINNMMDIRTYDPEIKTILLEQNYRSSKTIVEASNGFISNNKKQLEKVSYTANDVGSPVFVYDSLDESREAEFVVNAIEGLIKQKGMDYSDFAVLYRANALSRNIEFAFGRAGIPYSVVGGTEFYERDEIKTIVCLLRAVDNDMDDLAFERIINKPKRGIGETTINRIKMYATEANIPFSKAMEHIEDIPKVNKPTKAKIKSLTALIAKARDLMEQEGQNMNALLRFLILQTHFMEQYDVDKTKDIERIENIQELWNVAIAFDQKEHEALTEGQTVLTQFLTETALYTKGEDKAAQSRVTLTSVHSSKGLEFNSVFVIGVQAETFPSYRSKTDEAYEEERRLMYVAMTRAEKHLFLSFNRRKYVRGEMKNIGPSHFIGEIPEQYVRYLGTKPQA